MLQMTLLSAATNTAAPASGGLMGVLPYVLIIGAMFFFMSRSNKKKEKEAADMRDSVQVGDEIYTVGGIVGTVVKLEEETLLIESGADRSKIRITRSAVNINVSSQERVAEKQKAEKEARMISKEAKKKADK